jgi:Animal haem peroxidase
MSEPRKNLDTPGPGVWRPKSSREGIGPWLYVWWNGFYKIMEAFNRRLAFNPFRKVSWDKWPTSLGLGYLLSKIRFNRSNALTDSYDYAASDTKRFGPEPESVKHYYNTDGTWVSDRENPQMGALGTRFGSNIPPKKVRPDVDDQEPSARSVGKLKWRRIDPETGEEITIYAMILNVIASGWIQFQFDGNFGGFTKRDPVGVCPHMMKREPKDNWPDNVAVIDRTAVDSTRVTNNGRPTVINEKQHAWIQSQLYGVTDEELAKLRSFENGYLRIDEKTGRLPADPNNPGIDQTGFNLNYNPVVSLLHWLFVLEHNAIADHYRHFNPEWDDEKLFQMARKANVAMIARIHTVEWTEDLLQHPTLQVAMHADWYGFLGQRAKMYLMRFGARHPFFNKLLTPLRHYELIWGMPGSKWEHHDGPYQVPTQFRMVYRLHELLLGKYEIIEPGTDRTLDRIDLINFVHENTRPIVAKFGYDALAWSFAKKSCGALTLHNMPRALTQFHNQKDGTLTDLAERDIFRERTDGTGTYNEFRISLGEPPVTSFLELTGGDAELARELSIKYNGDIDAVDPGIGILAEPKPDGFALSFTQFYQFVLNAPRRVKSNRHLTEGFNYAEYGEGLNWVEHAGGILGVLSRHVAQLKPLMEGVIRGFAPWPETETFPLRLYEKTQADTDTVFKGDLRTFMLGAIALGTAGWFGAVAPWLAATLVAGLAAAPIALAVKRMLAMRFMQEVWKKVYTDKRAFMFGTLTRGEQWIERAAFFGRLQALSVVAGAGWLAWTMHASHPLVALLFVVAGLSGLSTRSGSNTFAADAQLLKVSLRNRMREGQTKTDAADLPGETALQKRYWFLKDDNEAPVATLTSMLRALCKSGQPPWTAFATAFTSLLSFGRKTQKGLTWRQKRKAGIPLFGFISIYLPHIHQAMGESATRIYARADNGKGLLPGDIDMDEFERMFRAFAPGRDYLTAYDFARMHEANRLRDAAAGRGNCLSRLFGLLAAKRRTAQLMPLFADRVVEEDRKLVPAISRDTMLRFYQGSAQHDLMIEHLEGDLDPSPLPTPTSLKQLASMKWVDLHTLYRTGTVGQIPDGDSRGRAIIVPNSWLFGKTLSAIGNLLWKGKVFSASSGRLVNKILGLRMIRAAVFPGQSWSDGKPAIILDYKKTSWLAFFIRDEIREIAPGLYLGKAYIRLPLGFRLMRLYFALDFRK